MMFDLLGALLLAHFVVDYPLQTDWMAANKHESEVALLTHAWVHAFLTYALLFGVGIHPPTALIVGLAVMAVHALIDAANLSIRWDQTSHLISLVAAAVLIGLL